MAEPRTKARSKTKLKWPSMYTIVFYNDNVTPYDFVVKLLVEVFDKSLTEANDITLKIHKSSVGCPVATYTKEIAEQKKHEALRYIEFYGFTLKISVEKDI